jgi:HEAT repeat protein
MSDTALRFLSYPTWFGAASFAWAIVGWLGAAMAPQLAFTPGIEVFHRVMPAVTLTLILINLLYALVAVFRRKVPVERLLVVTALQLGLFTTLFYQLDAHFEANLFWVETPTRAWEWVEFSAAHALRASDVLDTVEAFDFNLQFIKHRSPFVAGLVVLYHLVVDLFMLAVFRAIFGKIWKRLMDDPDQKSRVVWIGAVAFLGWLIVWLSCAFHFRPWNGIDIPIWFGENVLRVFDFPDLMDSYDLHWHQVPKEPLESTLTFFCRVWIVVGIAWFLNWRTTRTRIQPLPTTVGPVRLVRLWPLIIIPAVQIKAVSTIDEYRLDHFPAMETELVTRACGTDPEASRLALAAIRRLGPNISDAIDPVVTCRSAHPERNAAIIETLGHFGPRAIETLESISKEADGSEERALSIVNSLVEIGPRSAPVLIAIWDTTPFPAVKERVDAELRDMGTDAVRPMIGAVTEKNREVYVPWFHTLDRNWSLRDPKGNEIFSYLREIPGLIRDLNDPDVRVRVSAAEELGRFGTAAKIALPAFMAALKDSDPEMRLWAVLSLNGIGTEAKVALPAFVGALSDSDAHVRSMAARALGSLGTPAVTVLIAALNDPDKEVMSEAAGALAHIGPAAKEAVPALITAMKGPIAQSAAAALGRIGPAAKEAVPALILALKDTDREVRRAAATALGGIGPAAKEAVPALIRAMSDLDAPTSFDPQDDYKNENLDLRSRANRALVKIGTDAIPLLIAALRDPAEVVQSGAARALKRIGPPAKDAKTALLAAMKDPSGSVRARAVTLLGEFGPTASEVPALIEAMKDQEKEVRRPTAIALSMIGPEAKEAVPVLIKALKDPDEEIRLSTAKALGKIGPAAKLAVPALIEALSDPNNYVRDYAAGALGDIGPASKEAVPALIKALKDKSTQLMAVIALQKIGPDAKEAIPAIKDAMKDGKIGVYGELALQRIQAK